MLFDAVGTLIDPDPPAAEAYFTAGQRHGSRLRLDEIRQRFRAAVSAWNEPGELHDSRSGLPSRTSDHASVLERPRTDEAQERRRWQSLVEAVFDDVPDAGGQLFESLWGHFAQAHHWRVHDDVPETFVRLREHGIQLGIASNFDARLLTVAAGHPPLAAADAVFISSALGYSKPDPRFFRAVERQLAAAPDDIVLVGDDPINDVLGARDAGWRAVLLDRQSPASEGSIRSLAELPRLLETRRRRP